MTPLFISAFINEFSNADIDRSALRGSIFVITALIALTLAVICIVLAFKKQGEKEKKKKKKRRKKC